MAKRVSMESLEAFMRTSVVVLELNDPHDDRAGRDISRRCESALITAATSCLAPSIFSREMSELRSWRISRIVRRFFAPVFSPDDRLRLLLRVDESDDDDSRSSYHGGVNSRTASPSFRLGLERALEMPPSNLRAGRFGLLSNQASVDREYAYAHRLLADRFPGQLRARFTPQHGFWSEEQDNMIESPHRTDPETGVPVYSLYADRRKPLQEMLDGIDLFVVDLQDVGTRVYTYVWTVTHCLEACAEARVPVLVLDRPNPLGRRVEGPRLDPAFRSFVGRAPVPMAHGLTLGELSLYLNRLLSIDAEIEVIPVAGWGGEMFHHCGRPWIPPSPNLPRFEGALVYPGQVLVEGTQLSEGRGTTTPFEVFGAPFVDPGVLVAALSRLHLEHVRFRPIRFRPTFQKHVGELCGGVHIHVIDPGTLSRLSHSAGSARYGAFTLAG